MRWTRFRRSVTALAGLVAIGLVCNDNRLTAPETKSTWTQGRFNRTWLEHSDRAFCYFTKITGSFRGDDEMVHLGLAKNTDDSTYWVLDGSSGAKDVSATAECSWFSNYGFSVPGLQLGDWVKVVRECHIVTGERTKWCNSDGSVYTGYTPCPEAGPGSTQTFGAQHCGDYPHACGTYLASWQECDKPPVSAEVSPAPAVCYLAGIRGKFNGAGESVVMAKPTTSSLPSILTVSSKTDENTVEGGGACLTFQNPDTVDAVVSMTYVWRQGQPSATRMMASNAGVCFLTAIGGNLRGDGEWVEVVRSDPTSASPQLLTGGSEQNDVFAEARCIRYVPVQLVPPPPR